MRRFENKLVLEIIMIGGVLHAHYCMSTINCKIHNKCRIKEYHTAGGIPGLYDCGCRIHMQQLIKLKSYKRQLLDALEGVI